MAGCIRIAIAALDATWPAIPSMKARSSTRTRNRLTDGTDMPEQHMTCAGICQAARRPAPPRISDLPPRIRPGFCRAAAFCRRAAIAALLLLRLGGVGATDSVAAASDKVSDGFRTADHVAVAARRVGDTILVSIRIDPGYHINANPASRDYLVPTTIAFDGPVPQRIAYPPARKFKPAFTDEPIAVYEDTVAMAADFPPGALDGVRAVQFTLTAQACTEQICLPPDDIVARASW